MTNRSADAPRRRSPRPPHSGASIVSDRDDQAVGQGDTRSGRDRGPSILHHRASRSSTRTPRLAARDRGRPLLVGTGFTVVRRGYDAGEVEAAFERAAADDAVLVADRDELARTDVRNRQQIADFQQGLREVDAAPSAARTSRRLRHMLQLAQEEAAEVRAHAHTGALATVEQARARPVTSTTTRSPGRARRGGDRRHNPPAAG